MREFDFLIIGQGLAGTCLSIFLKERGQRVLIADHRRDVTSSRVAAGFIHPITGRRIVKTWMADTLFPFAVSFYHRLEKEANTTFLHSSDSLEMISEIRQLNDWQNRSVDPDFTSYFSDEKVPRYNEALTDHIKLMRIKNSGWVNIPQFLNHYAAVWKKENTLTEINEDLSSAEAIDDFLAYNDIRAKRIIFCEGERSRFSPLWNWLPFNPAKGELLTVTIPGLPEKDVLVNGIFFVPLGNQQFRVGSTYCWNPLDDIPSEEGKRELLEKISKTIQLPFEVNDHKAGVRPATHDRRPFLGKHPIHHHYYIYNGLGSKGSTLAPWFAGHLTNHFLDNLTIMKEADINRFEYPTS
ncbi:MAG: hypothetical protein RIQ47_1706 [Bacteroidota bacterium]|jgi:glycine oxidase